LIRITGVILSAWMTLKLSLDYGNDEEQSPDFTKIWDFQKAYQLSPFLGHIVKIHKTKEGEVHRYRFIEE
jgi:hypothetical protein